MPSCVIAHSRGGGELYNIETLPEYFFFINSCMHIRQTDFKLLLVHLTRVRDETFFYRSRDFPFIDMAEK